jgi:hypothetical protein
VRNEDVDWDSKYDELDRFLFWDNRISGVLLLSMPRNTKPSIKWAKNINGGFNRLEHFELVECWGDIKLFIECTPIPSLKSIRCSLDKGSEDEIEIVNAIASNYGRTLMKLILDCHVSTGNLAKIAEYCHVLEDLSIYCIDENCLSQTDMNVIASLPLLKSLEIRQECEIVEGALSALARCRQRDILILTGKMGC